MKIGIDAREFQAGRMTGIARYLWHFLRYTTTSDSPHEYVLFCNQWTHVPFDYPKLKKVIINEKITLIWDQLLLPLRMAREKIDVFLTPYFKVPLFLSSNVVLIINDLIPLFFPEEFGLFKRVYFRLMCQMAVRRAARIVTISENSRDDIVKLFNVPADKIGIVHLAAEQRFRPTDIGIEEIRKKYTLPQKFILYVGNLSPHKNIHVLLKAYAALPLNLREQYKLVLGTPKSDKYLTHIKKIIEGMELTRDVVFTGFIEDEDLPTVYHMSSLFAFPSLYEGFGLPPLEAMACGCPVVSSNTSSLTEVLGDAALFFNPHDVGEISSAIGQMLEDKDLQIKFRQKGLQRAKLFSIEKMGNKMLDVFESVLLKSE